MIAEELSRARQARDRVIAAAFRWRVFQQTRSFMIWREQALSGVKAPGGAGAACVCPAFLTPRLCQGDLTRALWMCAARLRDGDADGWRNLG